MKWARHGNKFVFVHRSISLSLSIFFFLFTIFFTCCVVLCVHYGKFKSKRNNGSKDLLRQWHFSSYSFSHFIACCRWCFVATFNALRFTFGTWFLSLVSILLSLFNSFAIAAAVAAAVVAGFSLHQVILASVAVSVACRRIRSFLVFGTHLAQMFYCVWVIKANR